VLPFSMFFGTFAWSFVFVSLPFYILKMSTVDAAATLRWTGWILGISSLVTMVTAPFSARLFGERHPKRSFIFTQLLQGGGFFLMAAARSLPELFFSRMLLGFMGPVIATTLLAWMPPGALYLVLAGMGLLVVPLLAGLSGPGGIPREARS